MTDIIIGGDAFRVALTPQGVSQIEFARPDEVRPTALTGLAALVARQLEEYLAGRRREFELPVDLSECTPFHRQVLETLAQVPWGHLVSYGELARRVGRPGAARAVGGAMAHNPVPILIPCHRVVRGDGSPGGFTSGLDWKRRLLRTEGIVY